MSRPLTPRQEAFVRGVAAGKTRKQAFIDAGYAWCGTWSNVCRLGRRPEVVARLATLRAGLVTREEHLCDLQRLREAALDAGRLETALKAEALRGRTLGFHAVRPAEPKAADPSPSDPLEAMSDDELDAAIRELGSRPSIRAILEGEGPSRPAAAPEPVPAVSEAGGLPRSRGDAP